MKHIGLVGGLSPWSTLYYQKLLYRLFNERKGSLNYPNLTVRSLNFQEIRDLEYEHKWVEVADIIIAAINDLHRAGADFAAITSNTSHISLKKIREYSPLEILSIIDATADEIRRDTPSRIGLLGTNFTMEHGPYQNTLKEYGIDVILPNRIEREIVDNIIWDELVKGIVNESSKEKYLRIIEKLADKRAQGIILGCTEIPLLVKQSDTQIKVYDTAEIHARAVLKYASNV